MILASALVLNSIRWVIPATVMLIPSPTIFVLTQALRLFKPILRADIFEYLDEVLWSSYQRTVLCFFSNMNGTQIVYSGDVKDFFQSKSNALLIANHQTAVDWITVNMLTFQPGLMGRVRYMHKDELKYIPLFGLYFWQHTCINVGRYGAFEKNKTVEQLNYLKEGNIPTMLVIFPEGTRFDPGNQAAVTKSQQYAQKNGLCSLRQSLTPRTRGLFLALKTLHSHFDVAYDITLAYEHTRRPSADGNGYVRVKAPGMAEYMLSQSPKIHIHIRKIDVQDVPHEGEREVVEWLHGCFEKKDRLMDRFIATGQFEDGEMDYRQVTQWCHTLPYTCLYLGMTALLFRYRTGRTLFASSLIIGSLAGMLWMRFH